MFLSGPAPSPMLKLTPLQSTMLMKNKYCYIQVPSKFPKMKKLGSLLIEYSLKMPLKSRYMKKFRKISSKHI